MNSSRRIALPVLGLLLALGTSRAQSPASVTKAIKSAAKAELKALRTALAGHVEQFDDAVKAFEEALLAEAPDLAAAAQALGAAWSQAQLAGLAVITEHHASFATAAGAALAEFQDAEGALGGPYPAGCAAGDGGGVDAFIEGWHVEQEKARAKMEARLLKSRKLLAKKAGIRLGVQTRVPVLHGGLSFNADFNSVANASSTTFLFGVDLLLSLDPVAGSADAVVLVCGMVSQGNAVDILGEGSNGVPDFADQVVGDGNSQWRKVFTGVTEGNYLMSFADVTALEFRRDSLGTG